MAVDLETKNKLILTHGILMVFVWLLVVPLAVALAMLGRQFSLTWWGKAHMLIMGIAGALPLTAAGLCAFVSAGELKNKTHSVTGTIIVFGAWIQIFLGVFNHVLFKHRARKNNLPAKRPWNNVLHIWMGRTLFILALINIPLGMRIRKPSMGLYVGYAVWVSMLAILFTWLTWNSMRKTTRRPRQDVEKERDSSLDEKSDTASHVLKT